MIRVGTVVRQMRRARGLTQTQLGALADVSQSYLGYVERDMTNPCIQTLNRIAKALGTSLTAIVAQAEALPDRADSA